jgi:hypothetical protein
VFANCLELRTSSTYGGLQARDFLLDELWRHHVFRDLELAALEQVYLADCDTA